MMDRLAPPPPYKSQNSTPQISPDQTHLQVSLHFRLPIGSEAKWKTQRAAIGCDMQTERQINQPEIVDSNYSPANPITVEHLNLSQSYTPFTVNKLYLQSTQVTSQVLEGYAIKRDRGAKNMYRVRESTLRPRRNSFASRPRDETCVLRDNIKQHEQPERSHMPKAECHLCLKRNELGVTAQQYCSNSTLHGLRYVGDSSLSLLERCFWIISFIAAVLTASYFIWNVYWKWTDTPIIISLSPEPLSLVEIPFPSITVCNMNNAKKTEADRINQGRENLEKLLLNDICNFENGTSTGYLDAESGKWTNVQRFMINVTQPCTDMVYFCMWHENITDCEKIFNPTLTDEGICCNFNAVHRKHLFYNPRDMSDLNVTYPFTSIDWTPERGYKLKTPPDSIPWRPYGAGRHLGLTLVLDAEICEYYCSSTASVGFKMLLHNPVETPKIADFAFAVTPGIETRIIIRPTISSASPSIIRVPRRKRKCFFTSERSLKFYRTYTQRNCILECEANFTQFICNCVQHYMPKSANTKICGKKDEQCANQARLAMEFKLYDEDNTTSQLNVSQTPSCNCWPGCFELNYNAEISQSKLIDAFEVNPRYIKKDMKYFTENVAVVHLFFVDSQFTRYMKSELFGFTEFLSNTGGLLGLFMGFSVLSLVEILYFVTLRLWCRFYRQNRVQKHGPVRVIPTRHKNGTIYPFAQ